VLPERLGWTDPVAIGEGSERGTPQLNRGWVSSSPGGSYSAVTVLTRRAGPGRRPG
jgi:hypothetical protein